MIKLITKLSSYGRSWTAKMTNPEVKTEKEDYGGSQQPFRGRHMKKLPINVSEGRKEGLKAKCRAASMDGAGGTII